MKKRFLAALLILCVASLSQVKADTTQERHEGWHKANKLVAECVYEKKRFSCFKVWFSRGLIIEGKNIKSNKVINTKELHVSFFQVTASVEVVPYDGKYVQLIFKGDTGFNEFKLWRGYGIATVQMEHPTYRKKPIHITAYVPKGNSIGFARVHGEVTIVNEKFFHEVMKKAPSKTIFRSIVK